MSLPRDFPAAVIAPLRRPAREARREAWQAVYSGPVWQRHRRAAHATMAAGPAPLLVLLSIVLRQEDSPQSRQVEAPHRHGGH